MREAFRRLWLGLSLIVGAAVILLLSDTSRRHAGGGGPPGADSEDAVLKVALLQMASQPIMDDGAAGVVEGLRERGYVEGRTLSLRRFNAEGDTAVANAMAQEVTGGDYDLIVTLSTSCLQAVANANKQRRIPHVFGMVADPRQSGVGVGQGPQEHPAHLVGIGTMPPVAESLRMAKQIRPSLARIGVVWNPAEINSEICTKLAREECGKLKMELLEANAENTASVKDAAASLVARGVDALWIGGDVTTLAAVDVVVRTAKAARIPVFTCIPGNAAKGTLFDVGADYLEVGRSTGHLAAQVLRGEPISSLPVTMAIPPRLVLNKLALTGLDGGWKFPEELLARADSVIDEQGEHDKREEIAAASAKPSTSASPIRKAFIEAVSYVNTKDTEESLHGLQEGLKRAGLVDGRDFELKIVNAQGDMATLNALVDAAVSRSANLILTVSTQALQNAVQRTRSTPVVFTMVANPFTAGVGKSDSEHHPLVTGSYGANDVDAMIPIIRRLMPQARRIGALYAPAESNSAYSHQLLVDAMSRTDFELISLPINSPSDVPDAAQSLCGRQLDLICLPNSNLAGSSFPSIVRAAQRAKIPVFGFLGSIASQGASVVLTRDYFDMGSDAGELAAKVLRGEKPAEIHFHKATNSRLLVNPSAAAECGLNLPESFIKSADSIIKP